MFAGICYLRKFPEKQSSDPPAEICSYEWPSMSHLVFAFWVNMNPTCCPHNTILTASQLFKLLKGWFLSFSSFWKWKHYWRHMIPQCFCYHVIWLVFQQDAFSGHSRKILEYVSKNCIWTSFYLLNMFV